MKALPGWCVIEAEEKKEQAGLALPDSAQSEMQRGTVVEVNPTWLKDGETYTLNTVEAGCRVVFKKYHDNELDVDGKKYKVVHLDQVMVIL